MTIGRCAPRATRPNNNNNKSVIFLAGAARSHMPISSIYLQSEG